MQRLTISVDDDIAQAFDELIEKRRYKNRSEAFRDLLRRELAQDAFEGKNGECVAVVSYTYDHHARRLSSKMIEQQHDHHNLVISSMHVHVSRNKCVECVVMRGSFDRIRGMAQDTIAETGIEEGAVNYIAVPEPESDDAAHHHEHHHDHGHDPDHDAGQIAARGKQQ